MKKSVLLIISGPAGSGKNTVAERLMSEFPGVKRVVTSTSRPPRGRELDGIDYNFLSTEEFARNIELGNFYEYAKVHDRYYGTPKKSITDAFAKGGDLVLIIDVQGAKTWKKIAEENPELSENLITVFIAPPSIEELRSRLRGRGTESEDEIERRMKTAENELQQADSFDFLINSKSRDEDYAALGKIYLDAKNS